MNQFKTNKIEWITKTVSNKKKKKISKFLIQVQINKAQI